MTAVGFALFVIGAVWAALIDDQFSDWNVAAGFLICVGGGLMLAGISTWPWRVMP